MDKLHIEGMNFVDESGRQILLNGLCFICREREKGYLEPGICEKLTWYSGHGFNVVRLGIFWDGVEPEPGRYDDAYLASIKAVVQHAEKCGIYVFLDMHQDLYSVKYIDGAPVWATLDEGLPHPEGCDIWYEAYVKSPAIMKAADNFWANAPAEDGLGLLDHYEKMWEHIAQYFADCPNLLGLEPMNEPYMGSIAPMTFAEATAEVQKENPAFDLTDPSTIRPEDTAIMQQAMNEHFIKFDKEILMPFYQRMLRAIRKYTDAALVTGGNIYCSSFVTTGIEKLTESQIYAPHGYDAVVDSDRYDEYNKDNVAFVFAGKRESQIRLNLPVIVGEWGNFPSGDYTQDLICYMNEILEDYLWSSTYHQYCVGMEEDAHYNTLERGYPMATAGELKAYHYDQKSGILTAKWNAVPGKETRIYMPHRVAPDEVTASCPIQVWVEEIPEREGCHVLVKAPEAGETEIRIVHPDSAH